MCFPCVCLFVLHGFVFVFFLFLLVSAAVCECGTPWTCLLTFSFYNNMNENDIFRRKSVTNRYKMFG